MERFQFNVDHPVKTWERASVTIEAETVVEARKKIIELAKKGFDYTDDTVSVDWETMLEANVPFTNKKNEAIVEVLDGMDDTVIYNNWDKESKKQWNKEYSSKV